ncbi:hypothetical protein HGA88_01075 [Candidatus Roizmanbacteria bacterium]|nr:hypothetical protein [Candidatus Roizmanbacteria bacterium]
MKVILGIGVLYALTIQSVSAQERFFQVQSIDTMKYSRDTAREKLNDSSFDQEIEIQVKNIAATGATHVAIATPYDEEFLPFLKRWVAAARFNHLKVWFRGNWSGWEGWFDYPPIDAATHLEKTKTFILSNRSLFEDGDVFTACPECENGGPGDPRKTQKIADFRAFLVAENTVVNNTFQIIDKKVTTHYYSMNGDVARVVMDKQTTIDLGGVITIDHYVATPDLLITDIKNYISHTQGTVALGEFGAPIPDINGPLSEKEQALWIDSALNKLVQIPQLVAINYWTNKGSSTALWNDDNTPRQGVAVLTTYFKPYTLSGVVRGKDGNALSDVLAIGKERSYISKDGTYVLPVLEGETITFQKQSYISKSVTITGNNTKNIHQNIVLEMKSPSLFHQILFQVLHFFKSLHIW